MKKYSPTGIYNKESHELRYRPSMHESQWNKDPAPDYDFSALNTLAKYRFGIKLPTSGKIVIDFDKNQIVGFELAEEPKKKTKK